MKPTKQTPDSRPLIAVRPLLVNNSELQYEVIEDVKIKLTKKRAVEILELDTFKGERPVNEHHVQALYEAHRAGRFMWEHVLIGLCQLDGRLFRVNGQHTCWMRLNIDDENIIVRQITYRVTSEQALHDLYCTFDQGKSRSAGHISAILLSDIAGPTIWNSALNTLSGGLKFWVFSEDREKRRIRPQDMATLIGGKYRDLFLKVGEFVQSMWDTDKACRRISVVAAIFATFDSAPQKALDFWTPVFSGLNLESKTDPRWQLRRYLSEHGHGSGAKSVVTQEDTFRVCVSAWNKWRTGEQVVQGLRPTEKRLKPK